MVLIVAFTWCTCRRASRLVRRVTQHWFRHMLASTLNDRNVEPEDHHKPAELEGPQIGPAPHPC